MQAENAPPGSIPEKTLLFISLDEAGGFWGEKAEELKEAGLTGVVVSSEDDVVKAVEAGLAVVYNVPEGEVRERKRSCESRRTSGNYETSKARGASGLGHSVVIQHQPTKHSNT